MPTSSSARPTRCRRRPTSSARADRLRAQARRLESQKADLQASGDQLTAQANQLRAQADQLQQQGAELQQAGVRLQQQADALKGEQQTAEQQKKEAEKLQKQLTKMVTAAGGDPRATDPRVVKLQDDLSATDGVKTLTPPQTNKKGDVVLLSAVPTTAPATDATADLLNDVRDDVVPKATAEGGITTYVGGYTASYADLASLISQRLLLVIGTVILLGFVLLMIAFRSILVPLQAAVTNVLSAAAAFGILTACFQWGWGIDLVGLDTSSSTVPIASYVPLMMFAVLFGLSMDYEVFLVSHIQQHHLAGEPARQAAASGLRTSARITTAACLIMTSVFASFILNGDPTIKQFGVGLASAVLLAGVLVITLAPATIAMMGEAAWWLPAWLDKLLPHMDIEGGGELDDDGGGGARPGTAGAARPRLPGAGGALASVTSGLLVFQGVVVTTVVDGLARDVFQQPARASGAAPQLQKRLLDADVEALGQDALGLLDRYPALQGGLQLHDQRHLLVGEPDVLDRYRGHIGHRLRNLCRRSVRGWLLGGAEQVQRADHPPGHPHRHGDDAAESRFRSGRRESRPRADGPVQFVRDDGAAAIAIQAGALVVLDLEEFQELRLCAGGDHHMEAVVRIGQQQPCGGHVQHLNATIDQSLQQLMHVELADRGLDELRKRLRQPLHVPQRTMTGVHCPPLLSETAAPTSSRSNAFSHRDDMPWLAMHKEPAAPPTLRRHVSSDLKRERSRGVSAVGDHRRL